MKSFCESSLFKDYIKDGKQAIKREHRSKIADNPKNRFIKSIDFDEASTLKKLEPKLKRWDYFLSTSNQPDKMVALEVHPFKQSEILKKRKDTERILKKHCPNAYLEISSWHVVVTGEMHSDHALRFSADFGIKLHRKFQTSR